jgi:hypothetical protein
LKNYSTSAGSTGIRRGSGALLRLNLAPLMGRRDAAYDAVAEYASGPCIFPQVSVLLKLLWSAEKDSVDLISLLSSPDTIDRERNILEHIRKLIRLLQVLEAWDGSRKKKGSADTIAKSGDNDPVIPIVVDRISSLIRHAVPHLERYRAYAEKSASVSHADRYNKSYSFYHEIYQDCLPVCTKTVENKL